MNVCTKACVQMCKWPCRFVYIYIYIYIHRKAVQSVRLTVTLSHNRHRNTVLHGSGTFRREIKLLKGRTDIRNFKVMSVSNYRMEFI